MDRPPPHLEWGAANSNTGDFLKDFCSVSRTLSGFFSDLFLEGSLYVQLALHILIGDGLPPHLARAHSTSWKIPGTHWHFRSRTQQLNVNRKSSFYMMPSLMVYKQNSGILAFVWWPIGPNAMSDNFKIETALLWSPLTTTIANTRLTGVISFTSFKHVGAYPSPN